MKKAILIVSFGTTISKGREENIVPIVNLVKKEFSNYDVYEGFTSRIVIKRLRSRGEEVYNETEMMNKLVNMGYKEILVQSLHIVGGKEFNKMRKNISHFMATHKDKGIKVIFSRPLVYYTGQEEHPDDVMLLLEALDQEVRPDSKEGVLFVGHGGLSPENMAYAAIQLKALHGGYDYMRFACIESYPLLEDMALSWKLGPKPSKVHIYPLLLVVGDHALNDVMGDEEDSVKSQMILAGYDVVCHPTGLGARKEIQDLFIAHLKDAMAGLYEII